MKVIVPKPLLRGTMVRNGKLIPLGVWVIGGIGLLFALGGAAPVIAALPVLVSGERTVGTVLAVRDSGAAQRDPYLVELEYRKVGTETPVRVTFERKVYRRTARLRVGQMVRIAYDTADPQRLELLSVNSEWQGGIVGLLVGVGLLVFVWKVPKA